MAEGMKGFELYRHFDKEGTLLYVGMSGLSIKRLLNHKANSKWFKDIATVTIEHYQDKNTCAVAEREAIKKELPPNNSTDGKAPRIWITMGMSKFSFWVRLFTPARLAKELNIKKRKANSWENGDTIPSDNFKIKIVGLSNGVIEFRDFFE